MCEFCVQHGEGKKWYLNAKNYAADLVSDLGRRKFIGGFYEEVIRKGHRTLSRLEKMFLGGARVPAMVGRRFTSGLKEDHFGQVLPLEEAETVLGMATSVVRLPCACKWEAEHREARTCLAVSCGPPDWYDGLPAGSYGASGAAGFETLTGEEALSCLRETDREGLVHSVWTFKTPFIGAICNCEKRYCLSMRATTGLGLPAMWRGEWVAVTDAARCSGCGACAPACQFSAIRAEAGGVCRVDAAACFGCGVCRDRCPSDAIRLIPRSEHPRAAGIY